MLTGLVDTYIEYGNASRDRRRGYASYKYRNMVYNEVRRNVALEVDGGGEGVGVDVGWREAGRRLPSKVHFPPITMQHDTCCLRGHKSECVYYREVATCRCGGRGEDSRRKRVRVDDRPPRESQTTFALPRMAPLVIVPVCLRSLSPCQWRCSLIVIGPQLASGWWSSGRIILVRQFALVGRPSKKTILEHATGGKRGGSERR